MNPTMRAEQDSSWQAFEFTTGKTFQHPTLPYRAFRGSGTLADELAEAFGGGIGADMSLLTVETALGGPVWFHLGNFRQGTWVDLEDREGQPIPLAISVQQGLVYGRWVQSPAQKLAAEFPSQGLGVQEPSQGLGVQEPSEAERAPIQTVDDLARVLSSLVPKRPPAAAEVLPSRQEPPQAKFPVVGDDPESLSPEERAGIYDIIEFFYHRWQTGDPLANQSLPEMTGTLMFHRWLTQREPQQPVTPETDVAPHEAFARLDPPAAEFPLEGQGVESLIFIQRARLYKLHEDLYYLWQTGVPLAASILSTVTRSRTYHWWREMRTLMDKYRDFPFLFYHDCEELEKIADPEQRAKQAGLFQSQKEGYSAYVISKFIEDKKGSATEPKRPPGVSDTAWNTVATKDQLYDQAKRLGIKGRSKMSKSQLRAAVARKELAKNMRA